ncbi:MAG: hypothetical protein ACFFCQ_12680 [Promethearchaeota archaeon]
MHTSAQEAAQILESDLLMLVTNNYLDLAWFQSLTADYLIDEALSILYNETLQKISEIQEESIPKPIQIGGENLFYIVACTMERKSQFTFQTFHDWGYL